MILRISGTFTANPAELVLAEATGHVVASSTFLDPCPTHRTERHIFFVLLSPGAKLIFHGFRTRNVFTVPHVTTLEADSCFTLGAPYAVNIGTLCNNVSVTVSFRTVPRQWILIDQLLLSEPLEFVK